VYDPGHLLVTRLNPQLVDATLLDDAQAAELQFLVERHQELTGSPIAGAMLADWDATLRLFRRVAPLGEVERIERANEGVISAAR
jgi:glutamate synthase (NADPH) large chain